MRWKQKQAAEDDIKPSASTNTKMSTTIESFHTVSPQTNKTLIPEIQHHCQNLCRRRMRRKKALASAHMLHPLVQYMAIISEEVIGGSNLAEYHHR